MSYILGALKKADKDRNQDKPLNFENWDRENWVKPSEPKTNNNLILYILLSALLLVLIVFSFLAYRLLTQPEPVSAQNSPASLPEQRPYEQQPFVPQSAGIEDASAEQAVPVYIPPYEQGSNRTNSQSNSQTAPASQPAVQAPEPARVARVVPQAAPARQMVPVSETQPVPNRAKADTPASRAPDLPEFSGHIYFATNSRLSRVFSGSNSFREGETVGGYRIKSIREAEVILDYQGREYRVRSTQ